MSINITTKYSLKAFGISYRLYKAIMDTDIDLMDPYLVQKSQDFFNDFTKDLLHWIAQREIIVPNIPIEDRLLNLPYYQSFIKGDSVLMELAKQTIDRFMQTFILSEQAPLFNSNQRGIKRLPQIAIILFLQYEVMVLHNDHEEIENNDKGAN